MSEVRFEFESLDVWNVSIDYARLLILATEHLESERKHYRLIEQLESAATSIAMNIAEGKGRGSPKDFLRFIYYAKGSLYESQTLLTIMMRMNWVNTSTYNEARSEGLRIIKMLNALSTHVKSRIH